MAFDWLTISFDLHDNKITKKPPGGGREAKNQPPFWTGGLGRFRKFGGCRRTGGYGRLRGQWVNKYSEMEIVSTVEPLLTDTSIIRTPLYYGQFIWSLSD